MNATYSITQGYMPADAFIQFLSGTFNAATSAPAAVQETSLSLSAVLLAFVGGLVTNLTPCVLPMIPVNLIIIGKSVRRAVAYAIGIVLAYGMLGLAASLGGLAFGTIQGHPAFNIAVAAVFFALGLALLGAFHIDFTRFRPRLVPGAEKKPSVVFPFLMGILSAALAGACVAPVLVSVLVLTADLTARGQHLALILPFVLGLGLAAPWPFLGAGMKVLPKPGAWMKYVNRGFAVIMFLLAFYYAHLAFPEIGRSQTAAESQHSGELTATPQTFEEVLASAKRPVLVDCWSTWCKNCGAMNRVLQEEKVRAALTGVTVIRLQAEDMRELRKLKGFETIRGLPAFVAIP